VLHHQRGEMAHHIAFGVVLAEFHRSELPISICLSTRSFFADLACTRAWKS
jgi:hypothetical protein